MERVIEILLGAASLQSVNIEDTDADAKYLAVPFGFRSLPLMVWAVANGYKIVADDPWATGRMTHYRERPAEYPANVSIARLRELELNSKEIPGVTTISFTGNGMERLPQMREGITGNMRKYLVESIIVCYELKHAEGSAEDVRLKTDYFLFEDMEGDYTTFYQNGQADVKTADLILSAADLFVRPHFDFLEFKRSNGNNDEQVQDYVIAALAIDAAMLRDDARAAVLVAASHFLIPAEYLREHPPKGDR